MPALLFVGDKLWIGTPARALCYQNGKIERFSEIAGEPFGDVRAIARDESGALWFGTAGGGLVRRQDGNFRRFKKSDGLSSDFIECLHFADDGALWIGTFGGGLDRFKDGTFSVINREQGLPNGVIGHIEADGRGYFLDEFLRGHFARERKGFEPLRRRRNRRGAVPDLRRQ